MKRTFLLVACLLSALSALDCGAGEEDPGTPLATGGMGNIVTGAGGSNLSNRGGSTGVAGRGGSTGLAGRGGGSTGFAGRGGFQFNYDAGTTTRGGSTNYNYDGSFNFDSNTTNQCPAGGVTTGTNCQQNNQRCPGPNGATCTCERQGRDRQWNCPTSVNPDATVPADTGTNPQADTGVPDRTDPPADANKPEPDGSQQDSGQTLDASAHD